MVALRREKFKAFISNTPDQMGILSKKGELCF